MTLKIDKVPINPEFIYSKKLIPITVNGDVNPYYDNSREIVDKIGADFLGVIQRISDNLSGTRIDLKQPNPTGNDFLASELVTRDTHHKVLTRTPVLGGTVVLGPNSADLEILTAGSRENGYKYRVSWVKP